jgi:hypothetical protein
VTTSPDIPSTDPGATHANVWSERLAAEIAPPAAGRPIVCASGISPSESSRMTRAGTPATSVFAGTSRVTTAPAATMAPRPMTTPGKIVQREVIQQPSSITTSAKKLVPARNHGLPTS